MILFALKCAHGHRFEAWFRNGTAYDEARDNKRLSCPLCGDDTIAKAPMAPRIARQRAVPTTSEETGSEETGQLQEPGRRAELKTGTGEIDGVTSGTNNTEAPSLRPDDRAQELRRVLQALRREIESRCDYVGSDFAEEARRIHYGESDVRPIYGESSEQAATELKEEGIAIHRIPWPSRTDA